MSSHTHTLVLSSDREKDKMLLQYEIILVRSLSDGDKYVLKAHDVVNQKAISFVNLAHSSCHQLSFIVYYQHLTTWALKYMKFVVKV